MNYSAKKHGLRLMEDFKNTNELATHVTANGVTKRNLPSLLASACHDPLGFVAPYDNNFKLIYRRVCRLGLTWDKKIPFGLVDKF